jgi:hypothetical protein
MNKSRTDVCDVCGTRVLTFIKNRQTSLNISYLLSANIFIIVPSLYR